MQMPKRLHDQHQPQLGATASDLGEEAYQANLRDKPGPDNTASGHQAGVWPQWRAPEPRNSPPGQHRKDAQEIKIGEDWKIHDT
jgi:hypothetical protein